MVTLTVQLDNAIAERLKKQAEERGVTVDDLLTAGAQLVLGEGGYDFPDDVEREIEEADAAADRGEVVSEGELMGRLRALRG
jgi:predicted transcriptional regulator